MSSWKKSTTWNATSVKEFLEALIDPEMYGWAVSQEVRQEARRLLENYDRD